MTEKKLELTFERADGGVGPLKRLPTRREMTSWIRAAVCRPAILTVRFVGEVEGRDLNARYRKKDYPTNVLTFDYAHKPIAEADIVVCTSVLLKEAAAQGKSFRAHLAHLLIHGVLHAMGYDHVTDEQAQKMEALETRILKKLGFPNPYSDRARGH